MPSSCALYIIVMFHTLTCKIICQCVAVYSLKNLIYLEELDFNFMQSYWTSLMSNYRL